MIVRVIRRFACLLCLPLLLGCGGDPETMAGAAHLPINPNISLRRAFADSGLFKKVVWENYVDGNGNQVVRAAAEYEMSRLNGQCPETKPGGEKAARVFLIVPFIVHKEDGSARVVSVEVKSYTGQGYYESYAAGPSLIDGVYGKKANVPCAFLFVPNYLKEQ